MSITREELEEYEILQDQRKALDRRAKTLKAREEMILEKARAELVAAGKNQIIRHGYGLILEAGSVSVSWKEEFIKTAGPDAASKLQEAAKEVATKQENRKPKIIPPVAE